MGKRQRKKERTGTKKIMEKDINKITKVEETDDWKDRCYRKYEEGKERNV